MGKESGQVILTFMEWNDEKSCWQTNDGLVLLTSCRKRVTTNCFENEAKQNKKVVDKCRWLW